MRPIGSALAQKTADAPKRIPARDSPPAETRCGLCPADTRMTSPFFPLVCENFPDTDTATSIAVLSLAVCNKNSAMHRPNVTMAAQRSGRDFAHQQNQQHSCYGEPDHGRLPVLAEQGEQQNASQASKHIDRIGEDSTRRPAPNTRPRSVPTGRRSSHSR